MEHRSASYTPHKSINYENLNKGLKRKRVVEIHRPIQTDYLGRITEQFKEADMPVTPKVASGYTTINKLASKDKSKGKLFTESTAIERTNFIVLRVVND